MHAAEHEVPVVPKIARYAVVPVSLPDEDPEWKFAGQAYPHWDACIVALVAEDGTIGWGYAAAFTHLGATNAAVESVLHRLAAPLVGRDALAIEGNLRLVDKGIRGNAPAKSGIDCALHDLAARLLGVPLHRLFGGRVRDAIPVCRMLALKDPDGMATQARARIDEGFRCLKLKVGGDVAEDVARVRAVRRAVGPEVRLTLDPNMSFRAKDAIAFVARVAEYGVEMIEQPVRETDLDGLALVTRTVPIAVEADESAHSPESTFALAAHRVVDAVSLKVTKMGGLRNVFAAARICEAAQLGCRMGATVGSRLLTAHAVQLCAALPNLGFPSEVAEFLHVMDDPFEGLEVRDGAVWISDEVGCGVRLRAEIAWRI
jgi:L-alanine-DL-glutamate epimerase-like enolase superfamily enzyme